MQITGTNGRRRRGAFAAAAALLLPGIAFAGAPGTWTEAGPMAKPRAFAPVVALAGGKALVVGGASMVPVSHGYRQVTIADSELFDAATRTWSPAGAMAHPRSTHQAVALDDGRVLAMGGVDDLGVMQASAELYNPVTRTWSAAPSMASPRYYFTATKLKDGRVLVAGGCSMAGCGAAAPFSEIFDPVTNRWSRTGPNVNARASQAAALLLDGRVMLIGGDAVTQDTTEVYDPATNQWTDSGPMTVVRSNHAAATLSSGEVLTAGGMDGWGAINAQADLGDAATSIWNVAPAMFDARMYHVMLALPDGRALAIGGQQVQLHSFVDIPRCEIYDQQRGGWTRTGSMAVARESHSATVLGNGDVLVTGGFDGASGLETTRTETFTPDVAIASFTETFDGLAEGSSPTLAGWQAVVGSGNAVTPAPAFGADDALAVLKVTAVNDAGSKFTSAHLFVENDWRAADPAGSGRGDALVFTNGVLRAQNASSIDVNGAQVSIDYSNGDAAAPGAGLQFAFRLASGDWYLYDQPAAGNSTSNVSHAVMSPLPIGPAMSFTPLAVAPGAAAADARLVPNPAATRKLSATELSQVIAVGIYSQPAPYDVAPTRFDNYQITGFSIGCRPGPVSALDVSLLPGNVAHLAWGAAARASSFDVVRGSLATLLAARGNFAAATDACLANDLSGAALDDAAVPVPADGFFYLVRAAGCSNGTFDDVSAGQDGTRDPGIAAAPATCP